MSAVPIRPQPVPTLVLHDAWARQGALWIVFVVLTLAAMAPTTVSMVEIWWSQGTYNHALAVPLLVAWMVWGRRGVWGPLRPQADPRWWPALFAASCLVVLGEAALANAPAHAGLVAVLVLSVPSLLGTGVARALAFPLGYCFFMVPVGDFLLPQMMEATATFTVAALRATGIPVYREGLMFVIPSGQWSVVEACSGIRYLIASLSVGTLYAYISYRSWWRRSAFILLALGVPIVANWLRAYIIVMLGHLSDNRIATGADHLVYGWVFFGLVMAVLFMIGSRWVDASPDDWKTSGAPDGSATQAADPTLSAPAAPPIRPALACLGLTLGPVLFSFSVQGLAESLPVRGLPVVAGWKLMDSTSDPSARQPAPAPSWRPRYVAPDDERQGEYRQGRWRVTLYQAEYRRQDRRRKILSSENVLVPTGDPQWRMQAADGAVVPVQTPQDRLELRAQWVLEQAQAGVGRRLLAVRLVQIDDRWMAPDARARLRLAQARLLGRPDSARVWVFSVDADPGAQADPPSEDAREAARVLSGFISTALVRNDS